MTAASTRLVYRSPGDRFVARLGLMLVRWADGRARRAVISHERRALQREQQFASAERSRAAVRARELRN